MGISGRCGVLRPFFFVGNKRSGTSLLVRLLNLHPQIFITHESDIVWLLYCLNNDLPFQHYVDDGFLGATYTLEQAGHLMDIDDDPYDVFVRVQLQLMRQGSPWLAPMRKRALAWIGDKKPVQQADPRVLAFTLRHFPQVRFVHLIRHPLDWIHSLKQFHSGLDRSDEELLLYWLRNERRVLEVAQQAPVCSISYKHLCTNPAISMEKIFTFLDLAMPVELLSQCEPVHYKYYTHIDDVNMPELIFDFWDKHGENIDHKMKQDT